jgi:Fic family protein
MSASNVLSADELAVVDATYRPIPAFDEWTHTVPRPDLWDRSIAELAELRETAVSHESLKAAVQAVMRAAAFDTGAIEDLYKTDRGLTMTVATQAAAWQADLEDRAPDARTYFEAQLAAYELVLDVATDSRPVTEVWIRHLHEILTSPQETFTVQTVVGPQVRPLPRGQYKTDPNHVQIKDGTIRPYAPVDATVREMGRLVCEVGSDTFANAHPVTQASYMHYCLVSIHPFADGNGRVARAVASTYFYRAASIPLLILADQKSVYLSALEDADRDNPAPFVAFLAEAGRSAVAMVTEAMRTAKAPEPSDTLRALGSLLSAQGGLTHHELDAVAVGLQTEVQKVVEAALEGIEVPPGITKSLVGYGGAPDPVPTGYRPIAASNAGSIGGMFRVAAPANAEVNFGVAVAISIARDEAETFVLFDNVAARRGAGETLVLGLHDVYPELTVSGQFRIRAYVERLLRNALVSLTDAARTQLVEGGYPIAGDAE